LSGHRRRTDAAKLSELPLPTPRKIAYFYAHITSIQDDLARLAIELGPGRRTERIRRVLAELDDALALGDDILRELRLLLSPQTSEVPDPGLIAKEALVLTGHAAPACRGCLRLRIPTTMRADRAGASSRKKISQGEWYVGRRH
jgi:hypothetical protein